VAFSFGNGNGGGNGRRSFRNYGGGQLSEINIVPLVDVVLVLLIIFMITAHVMEIGLEVDVPKVTQTRETTRDLPVVTLTKDGELYLGEKPANINEVGKLIRERYPKSDAVYVRADKGTVFDPIAQVFDRLGADGFKVNVVTEPADAAAPVRR
jgi:biopolymer transport protein ExbD